LLGAAGAPVFARFGLQILLTRAPDTYRWPPIIGPGTLYPLLHGLQQKGYLRSWKERDGRSRRRVFRATLKGKQALLAAKRKIQELFAESVGE
jgi:DNA-binding PadR family transcriptional regulator